MHNHVHFCFWCISVFVGLDTQVLLHSWGLALYIKGKSMVIVFRYLSILRDRVPSSIKQSQKLIIPHSALLIAYAT